MSDDYTRTQNILNAGALNKYEGSYLGHIDGTITDADGMPAKPTKLDILIHREKPAYNERKHQIAINLLGLYGGRPYVNARLSRFAGESEIDWIGGTRADGSCSTGRLQQTHSFPYLGRIAGKINQYVFSEDPAREGIDEDFEADITRDGKSINDFMRIVSAQMLAAEGGWIGIDSPAPKEDGTTYTQADKGTLKLRPYWQWYSNLAVVDWHYNDRGNLEWVKTRGTEYDDSNPAEVPQIVKVTKIWGIGQVTIIRQKKNKDRRRKDETTVEDVPLTDISGRPLSVVPFVQCGDLSGKPILFDDLESINRTIMDLQSVDRANLYKGVYPQITMAAGCMRSAMDTYGVDATGAVKMLLGFNYPLLYPDDASNKPEYITPSGADLAIIGTRIQELKRDMFEVIGLPLGENSQSKQVSSAAAKAWDFQDIAAVMKSRAEELQDIESKCVAVMQAWDSNITGWTPVYNTDFDVGDFAEEIKSLVLMGNVSGPEEYNRYVLDKIVDRAERLGSRSTDEELKVVKDAIAGFSGAQVTMDFEDEKIL